MKDWWMKLLRYFALAPQQHTYIVLHQVARESPSETVVVWDAYEAAPQVTKTPLEAIVRFQSESLLTGTFMAIRQDLYKIEVIAPSA